MQVYTDAIGRPLRFFMTAGHISDHTGTTYASKHEQPNDGYPENTVQLILRKGHGSIRKWEGFTRREHSKPAPEKCQGQTCATASPLSFQDCISSSLALGENMPVHA